MVLNLYTSSYDALYLVYICTKFHENILVGIIVIEQTQFSQEKFRRGIFHKNVDGVTVLVLCTSSDGGLYLYKIS